MISPLKKLFLGIICNTTLFFIFFIGIQNSANKEKVIFLNNETVNLPISFIIGSSFIAGSFTSSFLSFIKDKKD